MKYIDNRLSANIVKLEDENNNYMSEDVEGALEEIDSKIKNIEANGYDDTKIKQEINDIKTEIGTEKLTTTDQTIKGAVNEIDLQIKDIKNKFNADEIKLEDVNNNYASENVEGALEEVSSQIKDIVDNDIPSSFTKGTSFFCFNDESTLNYLINQPSRIENYKKCGIEEVLLSQSIIFDGTTFSLRISNNILKQASDLLKSNNIKVGLKLQDSGISNINDATIENWFSEKTRIIKELCELIQPTSINVANEILEVTSNKNYRSKWENMISSIKDSYPDVKLSVHTFFSEFYNGTIIIADLVDYLGVNYYPYTTNNAVPTSEEVKKAIYKPINGVYFIDTMDYYCKKYNKKFIISEWGTASFEYQCKNPSTDYLAQSQKVINPNVQRIFISEACRLFPYMENCKGMYLWSSNCYRNENTAFERSWAWDENEYTINAISNVWGGK